jgi:hypothetical protein
MPPCLAGFQLKTPGTQLFDDGWVVTPHEDPQHTPLLSVILRPEVVRSQKLPQGLQ